MPYTALSAEGTEGNENNIYLCPVTCGSPTRKFLFKKICI